VHDYYLPKMIKGSLLNKPTAQTHPSIILRFSSVQLCLKMKNRGQKTEEELFVTSMTN
jgi:hypothetical protein